MRVVDQWMGLIVVCTHFGLGCTFAAQSPCVTRIESLWTRTIGKTRRHSPASSTRRSSSRLLSRTRQACHVNPFWAPPVHALMGNNFLLCVDRKQSGQKYASRFPPLELRNIFPVPLRASSQRLVIFFPRRDLVPRWQTVEGASLSRIFVQPSPIGSRQK